MGVITRNSIVTNGLVLYLDAKNPQSIPVDPTINLLTNSQNFTGSGWLSTNMTVTTSSMVAPYGNGTATLISTFNSFSALSPSINVTGGGIYTTSYFVKYVTQSIYTLVHEGSPYAPVTFDIQAGKILSIGGTPGFMYTASISPAPNDYYRISLTVNITQSLFTLTPRLWTGYYNGNSYSGSQLYVWGAQVERSPYPTSYIASITSSGQRISWFDLSGNNNTVVLSTASISSSIPQYNFLNERVLNFDGTGSNAILPATTFNSAPVTVSLTFKRPGITGNYLFMWDHINGGGGGRSQRVNDVGIQIYGTNNLINSISSQALTDALSVTNRWTNLTYTVTGSLVNVYINGNPIITNFSMSSPLNSVSGAPLYIGKVDSGTTSYFTTGSFQSVLIYNRVLSQNEVLQNYQTIKTRLSLT